MGTITSIIRINSLLTELTPRSKLVFALSPDRDFAIDPKYVLLPVVNTMAVALPLTILEPIKPMLRKSVNASSCLLRISLNFSTGFDSPVKAACATNVSFVVKKRTSAGSISPAESRTISPGTISSIGISGAFRLSTRSTYWRSFLTVFGGSIRTLALHKGNQAGQKN